MPSRGASINDLPSQLALRLQPAVVNISTTQNPKKHGKGADQPTPDTPFDEFFKDFFDQEQGGARPEHSERPSVALGSGFIIDGAGYVVTNNHVIDGADEITVILHDDTQLKARLVGRDAETDLALLQVKTDKPLPAVSWGDSDAVRVGDWVMAVGNPFGLGSTVTLGILSARSRQINNEGPYDDFLQTDASINRGNSGGPLFDLDGHVIGINSAIFSPSGGSVGIGFAIPSDLAKIVIGQLRATGKVMRGYLGARFETVGPEVAEDLGLTRPAGALIAGVLPGTPAARAGLEAGDVVTGFEGKDVPDGRHLQRLVGDAPVGKTVTLKIWRKHEAKDVPVKLSAIRAGDDEQDATAAAIAAETPAPIKEFGLTFAPVSDQLRERYDLNDDATVVVTAAERYWQATDKGLRPGDVVLEIAHQQVRKLDDVSRTLADARKSGLHSVTMLIDRGGDRRFVPLSLDHS